MQNRCACVLVLQEINEAEGIESVHEAFRLGINFFDTSPFYGTTKSETVSAQWLASAAQLSKAKQSCSAELSKAGYNQAMGLWVELHECACQRSV